MWKQSGEGGGAEPVFVFGNQFDQLSSSFLHTRGLGGLGKWTAGFPQRHTQLKEQKKDDSHSHTSTSVKEVKENGNT